MKKTITFFIFLSSFVLVAQKINTEKTYIFKHGTEVVRCDHDGDVSSPEEILVTQKGWEIRVDKILEDRVIFYFPIWEISPQKEYLNENVAQITTERKIEKKNQEGVTVQVIQKSQTRAYYALPKLLFFEHLRLSQSDVGFEFGTATIPIKIRPKGEDRPFDFSGNFNAGIGIHAKFKNSGIGLYAGVNLTSVGVDSLTTKGFLKSPTNAAALTPVVGVIKELNGFQVGIFTGFDYLARELGENWIYQGKLWWGVGISTDIFTISAGKNNDSQ